MKLPMALGMSLAGLFAAGIQSQVDSEIQLEAAIHREIVMGDLAGALGQCT